MHAFKDGGSGKILSNKIGNQKTMILDDRKHNKEDSLMILDDKRMVMVDLYNQLHGLGICKTKYEFSSHWLNRSKRYYSAVINENRDISIEPLMNAIACLRLLSTECENSRHALLKEKGVKLNAIRTDMEIRVTRCITDNLHRGK